MPTDHEERIRELEQRVYALASTTSAILSALRQAGSVLTGSASSIDDSGVHKILLGIPLISPPKKDDAR